jgi:uncharacterized protein YqjF (DUF2071 family)
MLLSPGKASTVQTSDRLSSAARERLLSRRFEPLFLAAWDRVLMIHFEVDPEALQRSVPFELDLHDGRAFVSLVSFTLRDMRPRIGGWITAGLLRPIATHDFLNVRTYVRHNRETGIHFLAEWLSGRLAASLGPGTFSLPYRHGNISCQLYARSGELQGHIVDSLTGASLAYTGTLPERPRFGPCEAGSLDEWLMERYTAFNAAGGRKRFFRVWHPAWSQCGARVALQEHSLLTRNWPWFAGANLLGTNYSPGFDEVWMGRPHTISENTPGAPVSPSD